MMLCCDASVCVMFLFAGVISAGCHWVMFFCEGKGAPLDRRKMVACSDFQSATGADDTRIISFFFPTFPLFIDQSGVCGWR